jgi:TP901 family phage tail tape measure protein
VSGSLVKQILMAITADPGDSHEVLSDLKDQAAELAKPWDIKIAAETGEAQEQVDAVTDAMSEYTDAAIKAEEASARLAETQADESASSDELALAMDVSAEATVRALDAQMRLVEAERQAALGAQESGDAQEEMGAKAKIAGDEEEGSGLKAGKAWGMAKLAILGVGGAMVYGMVKAAGFQSIMMTLSTQAGVAKSQLPGLSSGVLALSGQVGFNPDSLAGALYHVESSFQSVGITGPKALSLLKIAAEGAATGHADLTDVTNALDATIVAGVPGIKSYSGAMGALNAIVGSGDMTMEDLATAMGSGVMAVAKSYGQSIYQVGAALATLGDNNIRGAKAATDLRMAWQAMLDPIATAGPALEKLGLTDTQLGQEMTHHGMTAALSMLVEHLKAAKVPMSDWGQMETDIFGKKAGVGIGILTDQLDRLKGKLPDIEKGASGFGKAWEQTQQTVGQQWKDLESGMEGLVTREGTVLLPMGLKVVHWLSDFVNGLNKGNFAATGIAAVIGVVLAGMALRKLQEGLSGAVQGFESMYQGGQKVVSGIGSIIGKLTGQAAATEEVTAATEEEAVAQGEADAAMDANPIGLVVLGIAALIVVIVEVVKHWKDFKQWGVDAFHFVEHAAEDAFDWVKHNWPYIAGILLGPIALATAIIYMHWHQIVDGARDAIHDIGSWFGRLPGMILTWTDDFGHLLWNAGADLLHGLIGGIESEVGDVVGEVEHVGSSILGGIEGALGIGSPSKEARIRGQFFGQGLQLGMADSIPLLEEESRRMGLAMLSGLPSGQLAGGGSSGAAGAGDSGWIEARMTWQKTGDPLIDQIGDGLRLWVRHRGGGGEFSAQRAFGDRWPV